MVCIKIDLKEGHFFLEYFQNKQESVEYINDLLTKRDDYTSFKFYNV